MENHRFYAVTIENERAVIPLHSGRGRQYGVIDVADSDHASQLAWFCHRKTGYPTHRLSSGSFLTLHALVMGRPPKGMVIDHINGDKLDNRRANLRRATVAENGLNRHRANLNNRTSSCPGVSWCKQHEKWRVLICRQGKGHFGGYFANHDDAATAARLLRQKLSG